MQQSFANLFMRTSIADRITKVHFQLVRSVLRREQNECQQATRFTRQTWPRPDCTPAEFGNKLFKRPREFIAVLQPFIYGLGANNFATNPQANFE